MFDRNIDRLLKNRKKQTQNAVINRSTLEKAADILFEGSRYHILIAVFGIFL